MKNRIAGIPILMFHSVSNSLEKYPKPSLVCSLELFEEFIKHLHKNKFNTISLNDLFEYKTKNKLLPKKPIIFTFDDGYIDNYVFAAPLLKKYGFSATIFISQDFIEKSNTKRATLFDVWKNKIDLSELQTLGYCSIAELKELHENKIFDLQAHGKSHTWYFSKNNLIGLYKQTEYPKWLEWNKNIEQKPFQFSYNKRVVKKYYPVFENYPSLGIEKRYTPSELFIEKAIELCNSNNSKTQGIEKNQIYKLLDKYPGCFESNIESNRRLALELVESKKWLESTFNKSFDFLAWPNGEYTQKSWELAKKHYTSVTKPGTDFINKKTDDSFIFKRIGGVDEGGNYFLRKFKILKLRSKIEFIHGNKTWVIVFGFIKILQKTGVLKFKKWKEPSSYQYNFDLLN